MKFIKYNVLTLGMLLMSLIGFNSLATASELNFAVEPELPSNQVDEKISYFDLKLDPGKKQTIYVKLRNDTKDVVEVDVGITRATTSFDGVVQYSSHRSDDVKKLMDKSFKNDIVNIVKGPKKVSLLPNSAQRVALEIEMPAESFDGVVAGGITFEQSNLPEKEVSGETAVINKYAYTVGLNLQNKIDKIAPELTLSDVKPTQINHRTAIVAQIHNISPTYINNVSVKGNITEKNGSKPIVEIEELVSDEELGKQIAPNSIYEQPFFFAGKALKAGEYSLDLTLTSHGKKWHFTKDFVIDRDEADRLNSSDLSLSNLNWWMILLILGIIVVLIGFWGLMWRKKSKRNK